MLDWIKNTMETLGYLGILALMFLENIIPPIPSEVVMPLAGFAASQGDLSFAGVVAAGTLGSVAGQLPLYYLGRAAGGRRIRRWADRHGRWLGVSSGDIDRAERWFERHGGKAVLMCRFIPGIRSLVSVPAGVCGMHLGVFLIYSAVGMGLWAAALAYLGGLLGESYDQIGRFVGPVSTLVVALVIGAGVAFVVRRRGERAEAGGR